VDAVGQLAGGQIERSEQVTDPVRAVVGRPQPGWSAAFEPVDPGVGLEIQGSELVQTDHPPISGRIVVQLKDPGLLGLELGIWRGLERLGALEGDPVATQIWRSRSRLIVSTTPRLRSCSASFDSDQHVNGSPRSVGRVSARFGSYGGSCR
jgi:hypothetical protein